MTLNSADERRLLDATRRASAEAAAGGDPTAAVVKAARDLSLRPGEVRLVCAAVNNGRQTAQVAANPRALDKFASFPLADPDRAVRDLYDAPGPPAPAPAPAAKAAAAPPAVKAASAAPAPPPPDPLARLRSLRKEAAEARRAESAARDRCRAALAGLAAWANKSAHDRVPLAEAEAGLRAYMGRAGAAVADLLAAHAPGEKRASASLATSRPVDARAEPFPQAREAVAAARALAHASRAKAAADLALADWEAGPGAPFVAAGGPEKAAGAVSTAFNAAGINALVGDVRRRFFGDGPQSPDDLTGSIADKLSSPDHEAELRAIRARTLLHSMLTDPKDPASGHHPAAVAGAFNSLAQVAPRASEYPAVMAPLLRRHLAGNLEPFEAKELTDVERGIKDTHPGGSEPSAPRK